MGDHTPTRSSQADPSMLEDLTSRISHMLNQTLAPTIHEPVVVPIGIKLDDKNYGLWSQFVEIYIFGKDKLGCINGDFSQPLETYPTFRKWRIENAVVKGWLINSMDPKLIGNYIRFPTVKAI